MSSSFRLHDCTITLYVLGDHYKSTLGIVFPRWCFYYRLQEKSWKEAMRMTQTNRLVAAAYHNNSSPPFPSGESNKNLFLRYL